MNKKIIIFLFCLVLSGCAGKLTTKKTTLPKTTLNSTSISSSKITSTTTTIKTTTSTVTTTAKKEYDNPYNISLSLTGNDNELAIHFEAKKDLKAYVEYRLVGEVEYTKAETTESIFRIKNRDYYFGETILKDLKNAYYEYRLVDQNGNALTENETFHFGPINEDYFTFMILPDAQENWEYGYKIHAASIKNALKNTDSLDLVMAPGDLINDGLIKSQYNWFFTYSSEFILNVPFMATPGNHEHNLDDLETNVFKAHFSFPKNGPLIDSFSNKEIDLEKTYSFDYSNVHFTVINSDVFCGGEGTCSAENDEVRVNKTLEWIENDFKNNTKKFLIVMLHRGPYSKSYNSNKVRDILVPLFEKYNVDLVINGHDHAYSRSVVKEGKLVDFTSINFNDYSSNIGVTYLVSNTTTSKFYGGKKNSGIETNFSFIDEVNVIPIVRVYEDYIQVTSYKVLDTDNGILEEFIIRK